MNKTCFKYFYSDPNYLQLFADPNYLRCSRLQLRRRLQNCDEIALTKLDCLSGRETLKLCTHYQLNGTEFESFPLNTELYKCQPVYKEMAGWEGDISAIRQWKHLPENARRYVDAIETLVKVKIIFISVGPERDALIIRG